MLIAEYQPDVTERVNKSLVKWRLRWTAQTTKAKVNNRFLNLIE